VTTHPRANLRRVLDDLGVTVLELAVGTPDLEREIGGVVIFDPVDEPVLPPGALVLAVGLSDPAAIAGLLAELAPHRPAGLIVRGPVPVTPELARAAAATPVLALAQGATWTQLTALLNSLLSEDRVGDDDSLGGLPSGDLFAVANAVAALLDAPVTIEDRSSRVLAFSGRQDEADASRIETVIGRQVPDRWAKALTDRGVFRDLYRYDAPVVVNPDDIGYPDLTVPRIAFAVRAGDEVLGSIWAATRQPLTPEREASLRDAARLVALHLLRLRAGADVSRRLRTDLVATALEGGTGAREALARLGLADSAVVVLGATLLTGADEPADAYSGQLREAERQRLTDAFALHLSAMNPGSAVGEVGGVAYGLFPAGDDDAEARATRTAAQFLERVGTGFQAVVAVGHAAADVAGLPLARQAVDRILRVLRAAATPGRVARLADVQTESLLLELGDLAAARGDRPFGPVAQLLAYDAANDTHLAETLKAWLTTFGDAKAAAAHLFIHPNTLHYRLRRVHEVTGLDLSDPDQRFAAELQLRILPAAVVASWRRPGQ
jgi:hypothetical protein